MAYQLLAVAMNQTDHLLYARMNLHSGSIVVNQCDQNDVEMFLHDGFSVRMQSCYECDADLK